MQIIRALFMATLLILNQSCCLAALSADAVQSPTQTVTHPINLDLSSTHTATTAATLLTHFVHNSAVINVGGSALTVLPTTALTPAERLAVYQVLSTGAQSVQLGSGGNAVGGSFQIGTHFSQYVSSLLIPQGVTALMNAATSSSLNLAGNLSNQGSFYAYSTSSQVSQANISAVQIANLSGGLISSVLPTSLSGMLNPAVSHLDLNLSAIQNIINAGTITSSGSLSLSAGGSIINALPSGMTGIVPVIQGLGNVNLASYSIANSGTIASMLGNLNFTNQGNITVDNTAGKLLAGSGVINFRDALYSAAGNLTITGGDLLARQINMYSGTGSIEVNAGNVQGAVNTSANAVHFYSQSNNLVLGSIAVTGDPLFFNLGDITLTGDSGGNVQAGQTLTILATGNINSTANLKSITANDNTQGYAITIMAGAPITSPAGCAGNCTSGVPGTQSGVSVTVDPSASPTGGSIDFSLSPNLTINSTPGNGCLNCTGGAVTLAAFSGTGGGGNINLPSTSAINSSGTGAGGNGAITVVAPGSIALGSLTASGGGASGGAITVSNSQPTTSNNGVITYNSAGAVTTGNSIVAGTQNNSGTIDLNSAAAKNAINLAAGTSLTGTGSTLSLSSSLSSITLSINNNWSPGSQNYTLSSAGVNQISAAGAITFGSGTISSTTTDNSGAGGGLTIFSTGALAGAKIDLTQIMDGNAHIISQCSGCGTSPAGGWVDIGDQNTGNPQLTGHVPLVFGGSGTLNITAQGEVPGVFTSSPPSTFNVAARLSGAPVYFGVNGGSAYNVTVSIPNGFEINDFRGGPHDAAGTAYPDIAQGTLTLTTHPVSGSPSPGDIHLYAPYNSLNLGGAKINTTVDTTIITSGYAAYVTQIEAQNNLQMSGGTIAGAGEVNLYSQQGQVSIANENITDQGGVYSGGIQVISGFTPCTSGCVGGLYPNTVTGITLSSANLTAENGGIQLYVINTDTIAGTSPSISVSSSNLLSNGSFAISGSDTYPLGGSIDIFSTPGSLSTLPTYPASVAVYFLRDMDTDPASGGWIFNNLTNSFNFLPATMPPATVNNTQSLYGGTVSSVYHGAIALYTNGNSSSLNFGGSTVAAGGGGYSGGAIVIGADPYNNQVQISNSSVKAMLPAPVAPPAQGPGDQPPPPSPPPGPGDHQVPPPAVPSNSNVPSPVVAPTNATPQTVQVPALPAPPPAHNVRYDNPQYYLNQPIISSSDCVHYAFDKLLNTEIQGQTGSAFQVGANRTVTVLAGRFTMGAGRGGLTVRTADGNTVVHMESNTIAVFDSHRSDALRVTVLDGDSPGSATVDVKDKQAGKLDAGQEMLIANADASDDDLIPIDGAEREPVEGSVVQIGAENIKKFSLSAKDVLQKDPLFSCCFGIMNKDIDPHLIEMGGKQCKYSWISRRLKDRYGPEISMNKDTHPKIGASNKISMKRCRRMPANARAMAASRSNSSWLIPVSYKEQAKDKLEDPHTFILSEATSPANYQLSKDGSWQQVSFVPVIQPGFLADPQANLEKLGANLFKMSHGTILITDKSGLRIDTPHGIVTTGAAVTALVSCESELTRVLNLSSCSSTLHLTTNKKFISLLPGQEAVITSSQDIDFKKLITADGLGRRRMHVIALDNKQKLAVSEFSLVDAMQNHPLVRALRSSKDSNHARAFRHIMKSAAAVSVVFGHSREPYSSVPEDIMPTRTAKVGARPKTVR